MGPLYRWKQFQDTIQVNSSPVVSSDKAESIFLTVTSMRDQNSSPEMGSGKGTRLGNSWLLLPTISCTKKEWEVTSSNRSFFTKPIYKETTIQDGDSQVSKTLDCDQRLGCLHRLDRCLSSCSNSSAIQKISSVHLRRSDIPIYGLTLRNVPKSVDFHQINGRNSIASTPACHFSFTLSRQLTDKRSDSQSTIISDNILPSNSTKSRFHSKSKEVRFDTNSKFHIYRHGISDNTKFSPGLNRPSQGPNSDYQNSSFLQSSIGMNFPFSFGQTQCSSRFCSPRQTSLTTSANVSFVCLETSHSSSRSSNHDQQYDSISFELVDGHQSFHTRNFHSSSNVFLFTDASHYGWRAHLEPMRLSFHGPWSEDQSQLHINMLEMMAILFALKKAIRFVHHSCVMISTDNTTVVSYINKQGGTHSPNLCV